VLVDIGGSVQLKNKTPIPLS